MLAEFVQPVLHMCWDVMEKGGRLCPQILNGDNQSLHLLSNSRQAFPSCPWQVPAAKSYPCVTTKHCKKHATGDINRAQSDAKWSKGPLKGSILGEGRIREEKGSRRHHFGDPILWRNMYQNAIGNYFLKSTSEATKNDASRLPEWRRIRCLNSQKCCPQTNSQRSTANLRRSCFLKGSNNRKYLQASKNKGFAKWVCDQEG